MLDEKINELEKLLTALDSDGVTIEEGISIFEKGIAVTKECLSSLKETSGKITELKKQMDGIIEQPLEIEKK